MPTTVNGFGCESFAAPGKYVASVTNSTSGLITVAISGIDNPLAFGELLAHKPSVESAGNSVTVPEVNLFKWVFGDTVDGTSIRETFT